MSLDPTRPLYQLAARLKASRGSALHAACVILAGSIKEELSHPGSGREYVVGRTLGRKRKNGTRGKSKLRIHRASAPGEPPAPDQGTLRASIQYEVDALAGTARVGTNSPYAKPLNFGTSTAGRSHRTKILPRPFMAPALERAKPGMGKALAVELKSAGEGK